MPRSFAFKQVDVFGSAPLLGNPVAVIFDADALDDREMQRIATWTNLSETTFVLRAQSPEADYRLRIFTTAQELPFAGHPTIGSALAVLEHRNLLGTATSLKQECAAGVLPLSIETMEGEPAIFVEVPRARLAARISDGGRKLGATLGHPLRAGSLACAIDVGPVWLVAQFDDSAAVSSLQPDMASLSELCRVLGLTGVTVFALGGPKGANVHVRSFVPGEGVPEDPVCGSGNAAVASYLAQNDLLRVTGTSYRASQGTEIGRDGNVWVRVHDDGARIEIGGHARTLVSGQISL